MTPPTEATQSYRGFEQGPIRPPSEARSLLIRVSRNCPWNRCSFCPVYKQTEFSLRPASHVLQDIDSVHKHVNTLKREFADSARSVPADLDRIAGAIPREELAAFEVAYHWVFAGRMKSVFLQDADALVTIPTQLIEVLTHLRGCFPSVERVTSYSRARTIASRREADLKAIARAGLDRIHVGLESGSDQVLKRVSKGVTKEKHIEAGLKVKAAGMELSEYVMPGLGGTELSKTHALESADALNRMNPHFIRLRSLALPPNAPLFAEYQAGRFDKCNDVAMAKEILTLIESLDSITSVIKSDHVLNLFGDLEGTLPDDKPRMTGMMRAFLQMEPDEQRLYQVGRRLGMFCGISDMQIPRAREAAESACRQLGVTAENVDRITDELMTRFV
ncbi:MAG: radical SAM protein [Phycisphaerales bacterium]|nr:MAG: radical SAM protein [Phycisphaerales bacterium]